ncbi:hypothetical protein ABT369_21855 [Dactylosporangium sp. NPDC000244]|uniref:hypothetical protein n=1 Tax=Dactylosporangium sp. NPDC000244 TaxID=3154365 RepID=UPI003324294F
MIDACLLGFGGIPGRRDTFVFGVAPFTVASLIGGFARSGAWLIAARAVQGAGAGAGIASPGTPALLTIDLAEGPARTRALGISSAVSAGVGEPPPGNRGERPARRTGGPFPAGFSRRG